MRIPELTWPAQSDTPYDDDLLLDIASGSVFLLIRGRNAWHSTWVRHYLRNATLYSDLASAKAGAETQRAPGNVFYIMEAPALHLRGAINNVVLTDAHPDNPFKAFTGMTTKPNPHRLGSWIGGIFPGVSVRDAVAAFRHDSGYWKGPQPDEHSLRSGRLDPGRSIPRSHGKLQSLKSKAYGANYLLGWSDNSGSSNYTRQGSNAIAKSWSQMLRDAQAIGIEDPDRSRLLKGYRESHIQAMPVSTWKQMKIDHDQAQREKRSHAHAAWLEQVRLTSALAVEIEHAEVERDEAREDRMHPADTSSGIRAQRERVVAAETRLAELTRAHAEAKDQAESLFRVYRTI